MAVTYQSIATYTATGSETSFTFSSLGTYTDLVIECEAKNLTGNSDVLLRFNSDSGGNYGATILGGDGSGSGYSARRTNSTSIICNYFNFLNSGTAGTFKIYIQNFGNSTTNKNAIIRADRSDQATEVIVGTWRNTAAITSVTLALGSSSFASGSTVTLYGIKAA